MIPLDEEAVHAAAVPTPTTTPAHADESPNAAVAAPVAPVTFLIYSPYPRYSGGRENWLFNVSHALRRRGSAVTVISHASNRPPFYAAVDGVDSVKLPSIRYFDRAFMRVDRIGLRLPRLLEVLVLYPVTAAWHLARRKPALLVCMNSIPEGFAAVLARRPFFVSVRGDVPSEMSHGVGPYEWLMRRLERWVLKRATRILANGSDTKDRLLREGFPSVVVPNGVDLARFRSGAAASERSERLAEAAAGRPVISVVGTLRSVKGTAMAMDCAAELKRAGIPFLMAMVGKGDVARYSRIAESKGVGDVVWFSGETRDVPAMLRQTDIFLGVSGGGGLSMAVLEAMAAGVPVVALETPVYTQLITHGTNGLVASSASGLALACRRLLVDKDERRRLGEAGSRTVDRYDWSVVADRLVGALAGE